MVFVLSEGRWVGDAVGFLKAQICPSLLQLRGGGDDIRTVGAGWDYLILSNWVVGVEGNFVDLGKATVAGQSVSATGALGAGAFNEEAKFKFWSVLGRITYKWGS